MLSGVYFPAVEVLSAIATAIVLGVGGALVMHESVEIGTLLAFTSTSPTSSIRCSSSQLYNTFLAATAALDRITVVFDEEPEVVDAPAARGSRRFAAMCPRERPLRIRRPARRPPLVQPRRRAGDHRRTRGTHGRREVDDREAPDAVLRPSRGAHHHRRSRPPRGHAGIAAKAARHRPAGGFLFAGTVAANIAFAHPQATRAEIEAAAEAVGADRFVKELPSGYDTDVGERGFKLSLGQRQLIAFARALLADPRILILDEATSSVDIGTERRIERGLQRLLAGRTAFVIAHRLSTIRGADLIVVLDHGRIVEQGTHDELVDARGPYMSLYGDWAEEVA